jgi:nucleoside-diphosphate-sugar epimerase
MRVVVIGGTGHTGTYLVPRLVEAGHEVLNVSRGRQEPYLEHAAWQAVEQVTLDRGAEEAAGTFGSRIAALEPDAVVDMLCFTPASAEALVEALRDRVGHLVVCGTVWVHGYAVEVPLTEEHPRRPLPRYEIPEDAEVDPYLRTAYGVDKAAVEEYLLGEARDRGLPATILHPGHIVGPGHAPVNPQGNVNPRVFATLARGGELTLPNLGLETLHHVHADDVAQAFCLALADREASVGESFFVVSPAAVTMRGYAETAASWFGHEPRLAFLPWTEWRTTVSDADAWMTWDHVAHSPVASIEKARRILGYEPRYSSLEAIRESVDWLAANGAIDVG